MKTTENGDIILNADELTDANLVLQSIANHELVLPSNISEGELNFVRSQIGANKHTIKKEDEGTFIKVLNFALAYHDKITAQKPREFGGSDRDLPRLQGLSILRSLLQRWEMK